MSSTQATDLYQTLKRLLKPQFKEVCLYLQEKYGYDLSYIAVDKAPAESANQLLELVKQNSQGFQHSEAVLGEVIAGKTAPVETPKNQFDKKRLITLLCDCPSLRRDSSFTINIGLTEFFDFKVYLVYLSESGFTGFKDFQNGVFNWVWFLFG